MQRPAVRFRASGATAALVLVMVLASTVSCSSQPSPAQPSPAATPVRVVGLGDSVPAAAGCTCTSFVTLFGTDVARHTGRPEVTDNFARNGLDTAGLLRQLDEPAVADAVAHADLLTLTIGANDFGAARTAYFDGTCGGPDGLDCVRSALTGLRRNLEQILARLRAFASGHPLGIRVTDYWNVFEVSEPAQSTQGDAFPQQSDRLTREANAVICDEATRAGDVCVDVYSAFHAAAVDGDLTSLLAPDGDHPNQAGHDLIARTVAAAGYAPLP